MGTERRKWANLAGCLVLGAVLCAPLYVGLEIVGGLLSELEQNYRNAHRTPVRYELPAGFLGKGEIEFREAGAPPIAREGGGLVLRFSTSGRLRVADPIEAMPEYQTLRVFRGHEQLPQKSKYSNGPKGSGASSEVGFYDTLDDDADPASGHGSSNRMAFFVGTRAEFGRGVKTGKIKAWE